MPPKLQTGTRIIPISKIKVGKRTRAELGDIGALAESIDSSGLMNPIIIDEKLNLISGHRRLRASILLKKKRIECRWFKDLSRFERQKVMIEEQLGQKRMVWHEDVRLKLQLHRLYVKEKDKVQLTQWARKETANILGVPYTTFSEEIRLALALEKFPKLKLMKSKRHAIRAMYRLKSLAVLQEMGSRQLAKKSKQKKQEKQTQTQKQKQKKGERIKWAEEQQEETKRKETENSNSKGIEQRVEKTNEQEGKKKKESTERIEGNLKSSEKKKVDKKQKPSKKKNSKKQESETTYKKITSRNPYLRPKPTLEAKVKSQQKSESGSGSESDNENASEGEKWISSLIQKHTENFTLDTLHTTTLFHADCFDILSDMPDSCADLILTDPQYEVEVTSKTGRFSHTSPQYDMFDDTQKGIYKRIIPELYRVLKPRMHMYIFFAISNYQKTYDELTKEGFEVISSPCIWIKDRPRFYPKWEETLMGQYETFFFCKKRDDKGLVRVLNKATSNIFKYSMPDRKTKIHVTQKPVALLKRLITLSSAQGDLVFDPFAGSASTTVAALLAKRRSLCVEIKKEFALKAVGRINTLFGRSQ